MAGRSPQRLFVLHDRPLELPPLHRRIAHVLHGVSGWPTPRPGDLVLWGSPSPAPLLHSLPVHDTLLSTSAALVREATHRGWNRAVLLPDLAADTLGMALPPTQLVDLLDATAAPACGELWTEGRRHRLAPTEAALVSALAGSTEPMAPRRLAGNRSLSALRATLARLRRRVGHPVVVSDDPRGWWLARVARPSPPSIATAEAALIHGDLRLDTSLRQLTVDDVSHRLSAAETTVMERLLAASGALVERSDVQVALDGLGPQGLDTLVHRLRKKVGADRVRTVRGRGWHLTSPRPSPQAEPPPIQVSPDQLEARVAGHPLVCVTGSAGPPALMELAREHRWATFDVRQIDRPRVLRWLDRRRETRVVLLGFDDPNDWAQELVARATAERGILVSSVRPLVHAGCHHAPMRSADAEDQIGQQAVGALTDLDRRRLRRLACFDGPFLLADAIELLHDIPAGEVPATLARWIGILRPQRGLWRMKEAPREVLRREHLPDDVRRTWARLVVRSVKRETLPARCRHPVVVARLPDLARAARLLVSTRDPLRATAMVLWRRCGAWGYPAPFDLMMACLETLEASERAQLLVEASMGPGVSTELKIDLAQRAEDLGREDPRVRWSARLVRANQEDSQRGGPERPMCYALLSTIDDPNDPAPAHVAATLAHIGMTGRPLEEQRAAIVRAVARLEEARWGDAQGIEGAWLQQSRSAALAHLGSVLARSGRAAQAEAAFHAAELDASPMTAGMVRVYRSTNLARMDRWPDADRLLVDTMWAPAIRDLPLARRRVLGTRAVLAAAHGPVALARVAIEQLQWEQDRTPHAFADRMLHEARAWLAVRRGDAAAMGPLLEGARLAPELAEAMSAAAARQPVPDLEGPERYGIALALKRWVRTPPNTPER